MVTLAVAALLIVPVGKTAQAHPADMYFQTHTLHIIPDGVRTTWSISPGPLLAFSVWSQADQNADDTVSPAEALAWAQFPVSELSVAVDDSDLLPWRVESVQWPESLVSFEVGEQNIVLQLALDWDPDFGGQHQLILYNRYQEATSVNWFYIHGDDGVTFYTPQQHSGLLRFDFMLPDGEAQPPTKTEALTYWDSGTPSLLAKGEASKPPPREETRSFAALTDLVREHELSPGFYLSALAIALLLGALHALTPGHGKALVGAYLVGSRGTMRHAAALGAIVTLTHTGSVLGLGMLTLVASRFIMPNTVFPVLEVISGLLVVIMGLSLLPQRWRGFKAVHDARQRPLMPPPPRESGASTRRLIQINQPIRVNIYDDVLPAGTLSVQRVQWRSLVALGISGGLVPCPDAIAILLVAVAINRIALGLSLIVAFSLGLALVLTAIGIAMVHSRRLFERFDSINRLVPVLPLVSAMIVIGLGLTLTYNALQRTTLFDRDSGDGDSSDALVFELGSEIEGQDNQAAATPDVFDLEQASILYLDTDDANRYQLRVYDFAGDESRALTDEAFGVWDYTLSPDRETIVYTAPREYGGSDLWIINVAGSHRRQLLACPESVCTRAAWSPDGRRLIYEKLDTPTEESPLGITTLWWLDPSTGETAPIFQDDQLPGMNPRWSPDGQWLSYASAGTAGVQLYNLVDGRTRSIASQTGGLVTWNPDGTALLVTDIWTNGEGTFTHLMRFDLTADKLTDLSGDSAVGDTWAAWSPDGEWIAVVRRDYTDDTSLGDHIWLMRPDGSQLRQLTDVPNVIHGEPVWSPDSAYLVFQRYSLTGAIAQPGIWLLAVGTGDLQALTQTGNWPTWLP
ncbi:MAG: PD40 domain-containing protein [Anaerolineae bacterium]|nr:PD40 domain-containing protein [Anaerolineae bacterium]